MTARKILVLISVLALAVVGIGAVATAGPPPVGDQINLIGGTPAEMPANSPVYVAHGWHVRGCGDPVEVGPPSAYDFVLEVDGVTQRSRPLMRRDAETGCISKRMLTQFKAGFPAGEYTFTGYWTLSCEVAVESGWITGPCDDPRAPITVFSTSHTVLFVSS